MITTIIEKEKEKEEAEDPIIMKNKDNNYLVLFYEKEKGIVLTENNVYKIGCYSNNWYMPNFIPFNGKVILQNK